MKPITQTTKKSHILYDGALLDHVDDRLFTPREGQFETAVAGRGNTLFLEQAGLRLVLRHYRRGGLVARVSADCYVWTGLTRSRPWREWHLLAALHALGLPVPRPVAARVVRQGFFYQGDLVTERVAALPLSSRCREAALSISTWQSIGACISRFHSEGAYHADLNAHNILLAGDDAVYLIDFDRGELRRPGPWREANLERLHRSLTKLHAKIPGFAFDAGDWDALLAGYREPRLQRDSRASR